MVINDDFNSLYPSSIIEYNISNESFICETDNIELYQDSSKYVIINVSDDFNYMLKP
jgi:DNA polymerase elongation subunit (family B)